MGVWTFALMLATAAEIDYQAPVECPDRASFEAFLNGRLPTQGKVRLPYLKVEVARQESQYLGTLQVQEDQGELTVRVLKGARCREVVEAMALVAVLTIQAVLEKRAAAPPPPAPAPAPVAPPAPKPAPSPVPPPLPVSPSVATPWTFSAGADVSAAPGLAPTWGWGGGLFGELRHRSRLSPSFRLGGALATSQLEESGGQASFRWWMARLEGCPLRWQPLSWLALVPCLGVDLGALEANGLNVANKQNTTRFWFSPAALARAAVTLGRRLQIELSGGVQLPLWREHYYFGPNLTLYEVPAVAALLRLGMMFSFH